MPVVSPQQLSKQIKSGDFSPVYFLTGAEEFLIDESLHAIVTAASDEETSEFNVDLLSGTQTDIVTIIERASAYPMMSDRRVVVARDVDKALKSRKKADASVLADYVASPLQTTVLVLTAVGDSFGGKGKRKPKKPFDEIVSAADTVVFRKLYDRDLPKWVADRAHKYSKKIGREAVDLMIAYVGNSPRALDGEMQKLVSYVQDEPAIGIEEVQLVVGNSRSFNVFELQDAVGAKDLGQSLQIGERMLQENEPLQLILAMMTRYFTTLWKLKEVRRKARGKSDVARAVGVAPFFLDGYLKAEQNYTLEEIRNAFESMTATDLAQKTGPTSHALLLQLMLTSIIEGRDTAWIAAPGRQSVTTT